MLDRMQIRNALKQQMREENLDWEEKTKLRQEKSASVLLELKEWMTQQLPLVIPKSPLGPAIAYSLPRWEGLSAYALHGQIEVDHAANRNNLAENVIGPLAIGRKAFLFAGSHQAAKMTAAMYSFLWQHAREMVLMNITGSKMSSKESSHTNKKISMSCFQTTGLSIGIRTVNLPVRKPIYTMWVRRADTLKIKKTNI